jgi:hypothetical protein
MHLKIKEDKEVSQKVTYIILYFSVLILVLGSCDNPENENDICKVSYQIYSQELDSTLVDIEHRLCSKNYSGSVVNLSYCSDDSSDCVIYKFDTLKLSSEASLIRNNDSVRLYLEKAIGASYEGENYTIYKFVKGLESYDNTSFHYWNPEFGVLVVKSQSWGTHKEMISKGGNDKNILRFLNHQIKTDSSFSRVKLNKETERDSIMIEDAINEDFGI